MAGELALPTAINFEPNDIKRGNARPETQSTENGI